jgi:hypothetical protein
MSRKGPTPDINLANMDKTSLFYNVQLKRTLALKGKKCQGGKGYKDRMTSLMM